MALGFALWIGSGTEAQAFGTKFVCCRPESVSCLGGGGATVWHRTLKDRALTQADAKLRCGFHKMYWATHSCPADVPCSGQPINPTPTQFTSSIRNNSGSDAWVIFQTHKSGVVESRAWYKVARGEKRQFTFTDGSCMGISKNNQDWIKQQMNNGSIFTSEMRTTWSHVSRETNMRYGKNNQGHYWIDLFVDGLRPKKSYTGFSAEGLRALFDTYDVKSFKCLYTWKSHAQASID